MGERNRCDGCIFQKKKFDGIANRRSTTRIAYRDEGMEEQYEGGRGGNRREEREYRETDDGYRRDDDIEAGKLATKLVQNELKRRSAVENLISIIIASLLFVLFFL